MISVFVACKSIGGIVGNGAKQAIDKLSISSLLPLQSRLDVVL